MSLFIVPTKALEQEIKISAYVTPYLKNYDAKLTFTTTKSHYEFPNITFNILLENTGKNYFIPNGSVKIFDENGQVIFEIPLNKNQIILQPQQTFNFEETWEKNILDIGNYSARAEFYLGSNTIQSSLNFSVSPIITISSCLLVIIMISCGYFILNSNQMFLLTWKNQLIRYAK